MQRWTIFHPGVFFLTFISYALYHAVRKTSSYVQSSLISEWTPQPEHHGMLENTSTSTRHSMFPDQQSAETFIGILNAIFLFVYAAGNFISGMIADRLDHRLILTVGMTLSAVVMIVFSPVLEWTGSYSPVAYIVLQILNALFQSSGWPSLVPVMANWFNRQSRGYILGLWSSSPSVGSILGAVVVSSVVEYGYEYAFVVTSSMLFAGGILVHFGLVASPHEVDLTMTVDDDDEQNHSDEISNDDDIALNGERTMLLPKRTTIKNKCIPYTSHGSSDQTYDKECSTKYGLSDDRLNRFHSTAECQCDTTPVSTAPRLHTPQVNAQTASNTLIPGADVDVQTEHICDDVGGDSDNKSECSGKHLSCIKHHNSKFTSKSQDPEIAVLTIMCLQKYPTHISHDNELLQSDVPEDSDSETSFMNDPQTEQETPDDSKNSVHAKPKAISFFGALLLPGVIPYAFCFAFLKLVIYVFFFWLPFYLASSYGWTESTADRLSLWFDVGGIVGATVSAFLMSVLNKSALIMIPMMVTSIPVLYMYGVLGLGADLSTNAVMLFCLGGLLAGLSNLLSAAVSADLSQQEALQGNSRSVATVTGILEGFGTVGAALGQIVVPYLNAAYGWDSMFYFLMAATLLGAVSILPVLVSEVKDVVRKL